MVLFICCSDVVVYVRCEFNYSMGCLGASHCVRREGDSSLVLVADAEETGSYHHAQDVVYLVEIVVMSWSRCAFTFVFQL